MVSIFFSIFSQNRFFLPLSKFPILLHSLEGPLKACLVRQNSPKGDVFYLRQSLDTSN